MSLKDQRAELALEESLTYSPDNFPGSRGWRANVAAAKALADFDAAHPEIIAEIKAAKAAAKAAKMAYWDTPEGKARAASM